MGSELKEVPRSKVAAAKAMGSLDAMAIELATGLSIADMEAIASDSAPEVREEIAVRFAHEFDRLAGRKDSKLSADLLDFFSKDRDIGVRRSFARSIAASPNLPLKIAKRLARDELDVATPLLTFSSVLDDAFIGEVVRSMSEAYALAIADRRPLGQGLVDVLIEHKGTRRVVARLLDNGEADISEAVLIGLHEWGRSDPEIADRLRHRPNLPFAFVNQGVVELADRARWPSLGERIMTRFEATQLQTRFEGKDGHRCSSRGGRFDRLHRQLKEAFEKGHLTPLALLSSLRDRDIDRLECGFSVMTGFDLKWVRKLLYGGDRRGLIVLCLKATFTSADYLTFRMALSLAELGTVREESRQRYSEKTMKFARDQFEKMRADPDRWTRWLPPETA